MKGFHLIEILVVVIIVSILTSLAFPLYHQYFVQAKRLEAIHTLSKLAAEMETYYLQNQTYEKANLKNLKFPEVIANNNYRLKITKATVTDYVLEAKPINQQAEKDPTCGTLILTSKGENKISGKSKIGDCW